MFQIRMTAEERALLGVGTRAAGGRSEFCGETKIGRMALV